MVLKVPIIHVLNVTLVFSKIGQNHLFSLKKISEYEGKLPQSRNTNQLTALRERDTIKMKTLTRKQ